MSFNDSLELRQMGQQPQLDLSHDGLEFRREASKRKHRPQSQRGSIAKYREAEMRQAKASESALGQLPPKDLIEIVERAIQYGQVSPDLPVRDAEKLYIEKITNMYEKAAKLQGRLSGAFGRKAIIEDQATRDRTTLEGLGFRGLDWFVATTPESLGTASARFISCRTTLNIMRYFTEGSGDKQGAYGFLDFKGSIGQAPFMLLHADRFDNSKKCIPLVQLMIEYMGIKPPRLIVSVGGSHRTDLLRSEEKLKEILKNGLSEMSDVWFLTDGLGDGISNMVAKTVAAFRKSQENPSILPVIGVVPWSDVPERQQNNILGDDGSPDGGRKSSRPKRVTYVPNDAATSWPDLDSNHTHFIFVRGGEKQKAYGNTVTSIEDLAAALRFKKDFQDAMTEDIEYFEQVKEWRGRFVDRGLYSAQHYQVIYERPLELQSGDERNREYEVILNSTLFPTGVKALAKGACVIELRDENGESVITFDVDYAEVKTMDVTMRSSSTDDVDDEGLDNIVVVHRGRYRQSSAKFSFQRGDRVHLKFDRRKIETKPYSLEKHQFKKKNKRWWQWKYSEPQDSMFVLSNRHAMSYLDDKNEFDHFLEHTTKINTLTLLVGGGERQPWRPENVSFRDALVLSENAVRNIEALSPIVIIEGSGGLGDVIAFAWRLLHDQRAMSARMQRMQLDAKVRKVFNVYEKSKADVLVTRIFNIVAVAGKVVVLNEETSSGEDLDKAMLAAIIQNMRPDFLAHEKEMQALRASIGPLDMQMAKYDEFDRQYYTWERKQVFVQRYELHLNALRFAMSFDRIEEAKLELEAAKDAWNQMETVWNNLREVSKMRKTSISSIEETMSQIASEDEKLDWWWEKSATQKEIENAMTRGRLYLSFHDQLELALEWALDENKLDQVKLLKSQIQDFPKFLYGRKKCRAEEGLGSTIAELYEYERHADVRYYMEPILRFIKHPPAYKKHVKNAPDHDGHPLPNIQEVNNVRMRRVWQLVRGLLYGDLDRECELDERRHEYFESSKSDFLLSPRSWEKRDGRYYQRKKDAWEQGKIDVSRDRTLESVWELIRQKRDPGSKHYNPNHADLLANQEIMIWAVLFNRLDMAIYFWEQGGHAIPNALLASQLFWGLANHPELVSRGRLSDKVKRMMDMSYKFEECALGVLSLCYNTNADWTQDVLEATQKPYDWMRNGRGEFDDSLELAHLAENKNFISHAACQAVIDRKWRGGRTHAEKYTSDGTLLETPITWSRIVAKVTSPKHKFQLECIFFVLLLVLHSYVVLEKLSERPSEYEYFLAIWFGVLFLEEIRQTFDNGFALIYLKQWWGDIWNKIDLVMYGLFATTFALRVYTSSNPGLEIAPTYTMDTWLNVVRGLYGLNLMLVYLRTLRYFAASVAMGPKIIILMKLVVSLKHYLILIFIFIFGYGIFMQAVLYPVGGIDWLTVRAVLYRPYFQIYGELMLEDIAEETKCAGFLPFTSCTNFFQSIIVPIVTGIYLIGTSLMVLNMLIADFTITFETVLEESEKVSRMQFFEVLDEFDGKPFLPPPLSIFTIFFRFFFRTLPKLFSFIKYWYFPSDDDDATGSHETTAQMEAEQLIEDFQDRCCDEYLENELKETVHSVDARVARIELEILEAKAELNFFKGKSYSNSMRRERRPGMNSSATDFLKVPSMSVAEALELMEERGMEEPDLNYPPDSLTGDVIDIDSLQILRSPELGAECTILQPVAKACELDVEFCSCRLGDACVRENFSCRMRRRKLGSERVTCEPKWGEQCNPFPNPIPQQMPPNWKVTNEWNFHNYWEGSDSMRGTLPKLGVNKYKLHIVTRWKRDSAGMPIDRAGKRLMEFVAVKRHKDDNVWAIPELHLDEYSEDYDERNPANFDSPVYRFAFHAKNFKSEVTAPQRDSVMETVKELFFSVNQKQTSYPYQGLQIYNGFLDDERSTANAWVMVEVMIHHDENQVLEAFNLTTSIGDRRPRRKEDTPSEIAWLTMHQDLDLCSEQEDLVKHVASLHDAYW
eukprot:m.88994 g.88994  ORF g.88994 m.88994 type:complete len:2000 (+) comp13201_c0_seq2:35-6034(+)